MKRCFWLLLLLVLTSLCIAQTQPDNTPLYFNELSEYFNFSLNPDVFRPVPMANESEQSQSIFTNSPQWVKDLRRGEIVFFGTLPFTIFYTRTIMGIFRMGLHNWDQRYAPWPFQSAGAVAMSNNEIILMFSIAGSVSLVVSVVDYLIVRNRRKAAVISDY